MLTLKIHDQISGIEETRNVESFRKTMMDLASDHSRDLVVSIVHSTEHGTEECELCVIRNGAVFLNTTYPYHFPIYQ